MSEEKLFKLNKKEICITSTQIKQAIDLLVNENEILRDRIYELEEVLDMIKNNNKRIIDYGFDYDGFNNVEDLKKLIDMLVDYARKNDEILKGV